MRKAVEFVTVFFFGLLVFMGVLACGLYAVITAKDVRTLARSAHTFNQVQPENKYALVWRARVMRSNPWTDEMVERRFLTGTKPDHISWWIGGAHHILESLGFEVDDEELAVKQA